MPASPSTIERIGVVDRLRAAGCVFAEDEARLLLAAAQTASHLAALVEERAGGVPLEQVLGWAEFCGLRVGVAPGVFVPRRRTELLAREAVRRAPSGGVVVDLCCGSGAVALVVARCVPGTAVVAVDVDETATRCARRNLPPGTVVRTGDLYDAVPGELRGRVDVIVTNPPYVPTDAIALMPAEARVHEPRAALDGGADGLDPQRRLIVGATAWLRPAGSLLVETGVDQVSMTAALFARHGLRPTVVTSADGDSAVVCGVRDQARQTV